MRCANLDPRCSSKPGSHRAAGLRSPRMQHHILSGKMAMPQLGLLQCPSPACCELLSWRKVGCYPDQALHCLQSNIAHPVIKQRGTPAEQSLPDHLGRADTSAYLCPWLPMLTSQRTPSMPGTPLRKHHPRAPPI